MKEPEHLVYVVDDDESVRRALKSLLGSAGLQVETYSSAQKFLVLANPLATACLVVDVRMSDMSGPELQLRLAACGSKIPVIFITAYDDPRAYVRAMKGGAKAFLQKPLDDQILLGNAVLAQRHNLRI